MNKKLKRLTDKRLKIALRRICRRNDNNILRKSPSCCYVGRRVDVYKKTSIVLAAITCMIKSYTHATKKELCANGINFKKDVFSLVINGIYLWKRHRLNNHLILKCWYCDTSFVDWLDIKTLISMHDCKWSYLSNGNVSMTTSNMKDNLL